MYAYVNNANNKIVALMPSTRGRPAANHMSADETTGISINAVPESFVETCPTAVAMKHRVAAEGCDTDWRDPAPDLMLTELLRVFRDILQAAGDEAADTAQQLWNMFPEDAAAASYADWRAGTISFLSAARRTVSGVLNDRKSGWREGVDLPAVAEKPSTTKEEPTTYGFDKLTDKPTFSVISESDKAEGSNGVFYPKPDQTYIISKQIEGLFKILDESSKKCPQNVNLIGPHGCGKTELAIQFAAKHNRPMLIMDCANLREARDWFGYKTAKDGTVYWHESQFVRAVQTGSHVILLDELNRANPSLLNTLMPILDARRFTYLEEKGDNILVGPGTVFFATMNEGAGYTGTSALDRAIRDRFPRAVELTYLSERDEVKLLVNRTGLEKDIATRLVQMANKIRSDATGVTATLTESISTRQLIAAAHDYVLGGVDTLEFTITNHFSPDGDDDSERVKVQSIIQGKFGDIIAAGAAAKAGA